MDSSYSEIILLFNIGSFIGLAVLLTKINYNLKGIKSLRELSQIVPSKDQKSITIIIPAYNEENRIESCLKHVLKIKKPCNHCQIILVDDSSTDRTVLIAKRLKEKLSLTDNILKIIEAGKRPKDEYWVGKNWACNIGMKEVISEWVLFIDADLIINEIAVKEAINVASFYEADLLSLAPRISCTSLSEWLVQPIICLLIAFRYPIKEINNRHSKQYFAAGPFMLFKTSSYLALGGHKSLAHEVVEDIAFAKKVKEKNMNLVYLPATDYLDLNMYNDFLSLWEGWTKNWFIALDKDIIKTFLVSLLILLLFTYPWTYLFNLIINFEKYTETNIFLYMNIVSAIMAISMHYLLRFYLYKRFYIATRYWWLTWLGGLIVSALGPTSLIKTTSGMGWSWKGRSLENKTNIEKRNRGL
tara:strand:+ start:220 stop:1461 length:1242 start_codon:yes stop_codon:yes gene_type:complete